MMGLAACGLVPCGLQPTRPHAASGNHVTLSDPTMFFLRMRIYAVQTTATGRRDDFWSSWQVGPVPDGSRAGPAAIGPRRGFPDAPCQWAGQHGMVKMTPDADDLPLEPMGRGPILCTFPMADWRQCIHVLLLIAAADGFLIKQPLAPQHMFVVQRSSVKAPRFGRINFAPLPRRSLICRSSSTSSMSYSHEYTSTRNSIFLVGKSSILKSELGRSLASRLHYSFFEVDDLKLDIDPSETALQTVRHLFNVNKEHPQLRHSRKWAGWFYQR
jgi:hypothetical protein